MKSKIQFILSMIIFGTIGVFVRYIDLSSSEIALLSSLIGSLFLTISMFMMKKKISWALVKVNALILITFGYCIGWKLDFSFPSLQPYNNCQCNVKLLFCTCVCHDSFAICP